MKKSFLICSVFFLIIVITIIKNSTKNIENEIFLTKENIRILTDKYDLALLDYNYLSSPKKLQEYQMKFFDKDLISLDINKINILKKDKEKIIILNFNDQNE
tara:strand:+ start:144 stop:449 length:306 start_codon:yes stop_codon:yes gene_type:complete